MGMRVLDYSNLESRLVEGVKGTLTALDVVGEEAFGVGLRVIPQHSKVPKPGTPSLRGRRILFCLRGAGTVSNGEYYQNVTPGKFVMLEDGESPTYATQDDELVVLEIRNQGSAKGLPPTVALTPPIPTEATRPSPAARVTSYDSV